MSKKKFTSGLDSLFGALTEEAFQDDSPLLDQQEKEKAAEQKQAKSAKKIARRSTKNFTSDLETLFEEALTERIEETLDTGRQGTKATRKTARVRRRPVSGLDALIRRTSNMETIEVNIPTKKRVTFVFDKQKLVKLKEIAKQENTYLKDIIGDVVSKFIEKYEKKQ